VSANGNSADIYFFWKSFRNFLKKGRFSGEDRDAGKCGTWIADTAVKILEAL